MSETTAEPVKLNRYEKAFQIYLLGTTVRMKQGGGVVFPYGFPGVGYRLEEWQFDRYRAGLEQAMLGEEGKKRARIVAWVFRLCIFGVLILLVGINFVRESRVYVVEDDTWLRMAAILVPVTCAIACIFLLNNQALKFAHPFKKEPKVSRYAFVRERFMGALVAQDKGPVALHLFVFVPLALSAYLVSRALPPSNNLLVLSLFFLPLIAYAVWRFVLLLLYWSFRLRNGRAPRLDDLQPVEAPAARAV